jgi:hypothetical protein
MTANFIFMPCPNVLQKVVRKSADGATHMQPAGQVDQQQQEEGEQGGHLVG